VRSGVTLVELTVMIAVLLLIIGVLFVGARAWKRGADRANCVINIRRVQVAMRSFANYNEHHEGEDISPVSLEGALIGSGSYLEKQPLCPGSGIYSFGGNTIPAMGRLYMTCSLAATEHHQPDEFGEW